MKVFLATSNDGFCDSLWKYFMIRQPFYEIYASGLLILTIFRISYIFS